MSADDIEKGKKLFVQRWVLSTYTYSQIGLVVPCLNSMKYGEFQIILWLCFSIYFLVLILQIIHYNFILKPTVLFMKKSHTLFLLFVDGSGLTFPLHKGVI